MSTSAIPGQFVRFSSLSDGTLRLIVDVPHEYAHNVFDALGFPKGQSVAIALLKDGVWSASTPPTAEESRTSPKMPDSEAARPRTSWDELPRVKQAAIRCNDERFRDFIVDQYPSMASDDLAEFVRTICGVNSRRELDEFPPAAERWKKLDAQFRTWSGLETEPRG